MGVSVLEVLDAESFDRAILRAEEPIVVAFWAAWCPFCRRFRPHFERASFAHQDRFAVVHLDEEDNPLWDRYGITVVPSLAMFRRGVLAARRDGVLGRGITEAELAAFLEEVLSSPPSS